MKCAETTGFRTKALIEYFRQVPDHRSSRKKKHDHAEMLVCITVGFICGRTTIRRSLALVVIQSLLYIRLSIKEAKRISFPMEKVKKSFRVGMTTAVGPSIAVCVVLVGMISAIGSPITWMRLSIIGAAATELTASTVAAESIGTALGAADFSPEALSLAFFTMAINVTG